MTVNIHGNEYVTVAERVEMAKEDIQEIKTEVLYQEPVVIKATVILKSGKTATGISAANPSKQIEKQSPYEVAETSAVGRALGFLSYGSVDSIASADEVVKASTTSTYTPPKKEVKTERPTGLPSTQKQVGFIHKLCTDKGVDIETIYTDYKVESTKDLTSLQASQVINDLLQLPNIDIEEKA